MFIFFPCLGKSQWLYYNESYNPFVSRIDLGSLSDIIVRNQNTYIGELDIAFNKQGDLFTTGSDGSTGPILLVDTLSDPGITEIHRFPSPILGLCVDKDDIFWASDWNSDGGLYSFDPSSNMEIFHGGMGHFVTDLEFYNGNLYAVAYEFKGSSINNILILVDQSNPENSKAVMEIEFPFAFLSLASFNDSCGSTKLIAPGWGVLVVLDPEKNAHQLIEVSPSFGAAGAASKSGWMGSIPPLRIDSITIFPDPCAGVAIIETHPHPGRSGFEFTIDNGPIQSDSTFTGVLPGIHIITILDNTGCSSTYGPFEIFEMKLDSAFTFSIQPDYCTLNTGQIQVNSPFNIHVEYSLDGVSWQQSSMFDHLPGGEYQVIVHFPSGCYDTIETVVPILHGFEIETKSLAEHCNMNDGMIEIVVNGGHEPLQYGLVGDTTMTNQSIIDSLSGGEYEIRVLDTLGCIQTASVIVDEVKLEIESITTTPPSCSLPNGSIELEVTADDPSVLFSLNDAPYQLAPTFDFLAEGTYTVRITDSVGCFLDTTVTLVSSSHPPIIQAEVTHASCNNANGSIRIITDQDTLYYSLNQGLPQTNPLFTNLDLGDYQLVATNENGCSVDSLLTIVQQGKPELKSVLSVPEHCDLGDGKLIVEDITGGLAPYVYKIQNLPFQSSTEFNALVSGDYALIVKDSNECYDTLNSNISSIDGPIILSIDIMPSHCTSNNGVIKVIAEGSSTLVFTLDQDISLNGDFEHVSSGVHNVVVTDTFGCYVTQDIYVPDSVTNFIDELIVTHPSCQTSDGSIEVKSTLSDVSIMILERPNHEWINKVEGLLEGEYHLQMRDFNNCLLDTTIYLVQDVDCGFILPNVFSPNGDQVNDEFGSITAFNFAKWTLSIFDRSGNLVFQSSNPAVGWNGTYKSHQVQSGVYTWQLIYELDKHDKQYIKTGSVTVLK